MIDLAPVEPYEPGVRVELDPVPLAVIRHREVSLDDIRDLFDRGYSAIGAQIATGAVIPRGPALAIYHGDPSARFDLELGFPVAEPLSAPIATASGDEIVAATLPAGPALAATHLGGYDELGQAWGRLAGTPGANPAGVSIEVYVVDPSTDPDALRTDLLMPVEG